MKNTVSKIKKAIVIGSLCAFSISAIFASESDRSEIQSWFITAAPVYEISENDGFALISDKECDVEIHFGLFEFLKDLFF